MPNIKLQEKIAKMINSKSNKVNPEDTEVLLGLYQELTKIEFADHHEQKNIHWLGRTFDHAPMVGALASLSSMQNEILSARAKAVNVLKSKVTVGEFSFNKIQELVSGPGVATEGEEIELKVTMAAYDSDNNPKVTSSQGSVVVTDGIGIIKARASGSGEMNLSGMVMIRNKSGVEYPRPWSWKVAIAKPQGSISLPEMSVLYKGWNNKVVPVVAGMVSSDITVNGGTKTKASWTDADGNKYNGFYVNITGPSKFVTITLSGKDKDGKSKSFGTFKYKVKPFPSAQLQGTTISKTTGFKAVVSLGPDSPFTGVGFTVIGGEVSIGNETIPFSGDRVPSSVVAKIKAGKKIAIDVTYKRTGTATPSIASGVLKVVP
jgi:gliding motility-associated protein GldM